MCCYGNMFDHGCAALVFLRSAVVVYQCDIHKVSSLLTGKKGQLKKEVLSVTMMTNFGFGPNNEFNTIRIKPRNLKGGIGPLFDPCVNAMGRRPFWPSRMEVSYCTFGLKQLFGSVVHRATTCMHAWFKLDTRDRQLMLNEIAWEGLKLWKKSGGTITHLHTWWQDDRHNRFPFKFPWVKRNKFDTNFKMYVFFFLSRYFINTAMIDHQISYQNPSLLNAFLSR